MRKVLYLSTMTLFSLSILCMDINLNDAINNAKINSLMLKKEKINVENINMQKGEAIKTALPSVKFQSNYMRTQKKNALTNSKEAYQSKVAVTQPVFDTQIFAGINAANLADEMSKNNSAKEEKSVRLGVIQSYIKILKFTKSKEVLEDAKSELQKNYDKVNELYKLGMVIKSAILEIKYQIIDINTQIIGVDNSIKIAKLDLIDKMGLPKDTEINLADIGEKKLTQKELSLNSDINLADTNNIDLKLAEDNIKLKEINENLQWGNVLPKVYLQFDYGTSQTNGSSLKFNKSINPKNWEWSIGASFTMDLWEWGSNFSKINRAKNEIKIAEYDKKLTKNKIEIGIKQSYYELMRIKSLKEAKQQALESAKEDYNIQKERLNTGLSTTLDFLTAENRVTKTKIDLINTNLDYFVARETYEDLVNREVK